MKKNMECIYLPELNTNDKYYKIPDTEAHHLKVLRLQSGNEILITSGKGISALAIIDRISKNDFSVNIIDYYHNKGELDFRIGLAIGIMDNRDRFEFAIEKCTELGVSDIFPLITDYSQQNKINKERLITKTISTIKQSKRAILPVIHHPISIMELINNRYETTTKDNTSAKYSRIILADENGITPETKLYKPTNTLIFIGPEGGFSELELDIFDKNNIIKWKIGDTRLRTETATIICIGLLSLGF